MAKKDKKLTPKQKTQKYLSKIVSDGKVTKKEAKEAQAKGIRLDRIQKAFDKSLEPGNPFSRPQPRFGSLAARYSPQPTQLQIRPGAQTLITRDTAARAAREVAGTAPATPVAPVAPGGTGGQTSGEDVVTVIDTGDESGMIGRPAETTTPAPPAFDFDAFRADYDTRLNDLMTAMTDQENMYRGMFEKMAADQAARMDQMNAAFEQRAREQELAFKTSAENMARGGLTPDFRIGADPRRSVFGTSGFRRRDRRLMTIAQGIAPMMAGVSNSGNLLNV